MCDDLRMIELISLRMDGMITLEEMAELEAHLAQCEPCKSLVADLEMISELMPDEMEVPAGFHDRVMAEVAASKVVPFKKHNWRGAVASAAAFAVVVTGTGVWYQNQHHSSVLEEVPAVVADAPEMAAQARGIAGEELPPADMLARGFSLEGEGKIPASEEVQAMERLLTHLGWTDYDRGSHGAVLGVGENQGLSVSSFGLTMNGLYYEFEMSGLAQFDETVSNWVGYAVPVGEGEIISGMGPEFSELLF